MQFGPMHPDRLTQTLDGTDQERLKPVAQPAVKSEQEPSQSLPAKSQSLNTVVSSSVPVSSSIYDAGYKASQEQRNENIRLQAENKGLARRIQEWNLLLQSKDQQIKSLESALNAAQHHAPLQSAATKQKEDHLVHVERELLDTVLAKSKLEKQLDTMKADIKRLNESLMASDPDSVTTKSEIKRLNGLIKDQDIRLKTKGLEVQRLKAELVAKEELLVGKTAEVTSLAKQLKLKDAALLIREEQLRSTTAAKPASNAPVVDTEQVVKRKASDVSAGSEEGEIKDSPEVKRQETGSPARAEIYRKLLDYYENSQTNLGFPNGQSA